MILVVVAVEMAQFHSHWYCDCRFQVQFTSVLYSTLVLNGKVLNGSTYIYYLLLFNLSQFPFVFCCCCSCLSLFLCIRNWCSGKRNVYVNHEGKSIFWWFKQKILCVSTFQPHLHMKYSCGRPMLVTRTFIFQFSEKKMDCNYTHH